MKGDPQRDVLLAAYVDGVGELSPAERDGVAARLADDAELRAEQVATRGLLDELRAIDAGGDAVDWTALERSIRDAVGTEIPRPWWKRWRWMIPGAAALAGAAAILAIVVRAPEVDESAAPRDAAAVAFVPDAALVPDPFPRSTNPGESVALWLDGTGVEVGMADDAEVLDALDDLEVRHLRGVGDANSVEFVVSDLRWVDSLDDDALENLENALEREAVKRKKRG